MNAEAQTNTWTYIAPYTEAHVQACFDAPSMPCWMGLQHAPLKYLLTWPTLQVDVASMLARTVLADTGLVKEPVPAADQNAGQGKGIKKGESTNSALLASCYTCLAHALVCNA